MGFFLGSGQATAQPRRNRVFSYFRESRVLRQNALGQSI